MDQTSTIIKSLNNLIEYSTDFRFQRRANFKQLHVALIKHFFNASSVVLDIEHQQVCLGIDMIERGAEVCIEYTNFTKFLKSCVRDTSDNRTFYQNILHYYSRTEAVA